MSIKSKIHSAATSVKMTAKIALFTTKIALSTITMKGYAGRVKTRLKSHAEDYASYAAAITTASAIFASFLSLYATVVVTLESGIIAGFLVGGIWAIYGLIGSIAALAAMLIVTMAVDTMVRSLFNF
jgi:hypothetical protein